MKTVAMLIGVIMLGYGSAIFADPYTCQVLAGSNSACKKATLDHAVADCQLDKRWLGDSKQSLTLELSDDQAVNKMLQQYLASFKTTANAPVKEDILAHGVRDLAGCGMTGYQDCSTLLHGSVTVGTDNTTTTYFNFLCTKNDPTNPD